MVCDSLVPNLVWVQLVHFGHQLKCVMQYIIGKVISNYLGAQSTSSESMQDNLQRMDRDIMTSQWSSHLTGSVGNNKDFIMCLAYV